MNQEVKNAVLSTVVRSYIEEYIELNDISSYDDFKNEHLKVIATILNIFSNSNPSTII